MTSIVRDARGKGTPLYIGFHTDASTTTVEMGGDGGVYPRADFIAAVETELDGTFIPHADLPKAGARMYPFVVGDEMTADEHRYEALRNLAWARDLEANPPADQAQVEGLARVLAVADDQGEYAWTHYVDTARRLVKAGVTVKAADR